MMGSMGASMAHWIAMESSLLEYNTFTSCREATRGGLLSGFSRTLSFLAPLRTIL